jgi:hypothetical protein
MVKYPVKIMILVSLLLQTVSAASKGSYFFPDIIFKEVKLKDLDKDNTLKIVKGLKDYKRIFGPTDIFDTVNHFYSSDIDNDKKDELLYYGIISDGGYWTIIWKADGRDYRLLGEIYGKINGTSDSLYISTLAPVCRGAICGHANKYCGYANLYRIEDESIDFQRSVAILKGVVLPDTPPIRKEITVNNPDNLLRAQPVVNDTPDSTELERFGILRGNALVGLARGTVATVTATYKDHTGGIWWFLVLDNPINADYNVYKEFRQADRRICGWGEAKFLDAGKTAP